ncbi:MAG: TIGR00269 family protein [Candidatus Kariarchaeaceae archaeon]|jgi:uncharacterized protein (TIGR00269 family)
MIIPSCSYCFRPAAWRRPWDKERLCVTHFNKSFIKKVQRTINQYQLFTRTDIIAVGISGGKDSVVLLDVLSKMQEKFPTKLIAITIDEGIRNYREEGLKFAKLAVERSSIEHHVFSYKEQFGFDLDDALILLGKDRKGACSYCGPFRRKALNNAAKSVGATKLATGHNADDEAQTVLMNLMRGDLLKSLHSNPYPRFKNSEFVNRVKPFRRTSEEEIVLYANFNNLPYQGQPCPYSVEAQRGRIRDILTDYMVHDPSVLYSILNSADALLDLASNVPIDIEHSGNKKIIPCSSCGDPCNSKFCQVCRIINQINT